MDKDYLKKGLTKKEVDERIAKGFTNKVVDKTSRSISQIISANIFTLFNAINIIIAILIAMTHEYQNMLFMGVVIFNTAIGIFQEVRAKHKLDKLKMLSAPHALILRDNQEIKVESDDIVIDDLTILTLGSEVLSDSEVIEGEVSVNESLLTGESNDILKRPHDRLYAGSFITSGSCKAKVIAVADDNYINHILKNAKKEKRQPSKLRDALDFIIRSITIVIVPLGVLLFAKQYLLSDVAFDDAIIQTSASIIGMIPEGLVLLTSVALSVGAIKLAMNETLTQSLYSLETLARTDVIFFDKTGTITTGNISVDDVIYYKEIDEDIIANILVAINDQNPTAIALRKYFKVKRELKIDSVYPFSSKKKCSGGGYDGHTYMLGAYSYLDIEKIDQKIIDDIDRYTKDGHRLLAISKDQDLVALVLLSDEIRDNAKATIKYFYDQGTDLKIISGDDPKTVSSIAKKVGFKSADAYIDCQNLSDEDLKKAINDHTIFGRVSPDQKLIMVDALKDKAMTVAMVGDGVNDVMALKEADCSIAMASGADSAKNIANIVLLDGDFSHMPAIVLEGRRVINNIQRTASLFLIKTVMSILLAILSIFILKEYPFAPIQLTLVSSLCIGFPSFILTFMPNYQKISGNFLANILSFAIPSAIAIVLAGISLEISCNIGIIDKDVISTMYTLIMAMIVIYEIIDIAKPLNIITIALVVIAIGGITLAYIFFKELFYFEALDMMHLVFTFIVGLLSILALKKLAKLDLADRFASRIDDLY